MAARKNVISGSVRSQTCSDCLYIRGTEPGKGDTVNRRCVEIMIIMTITCVVV